MPTFINTVLSKLSQLVSYGPFKEKLAAASNIPATLSDSSFVTKITSWYKANPAKGNIAVATALTAIPSALVNVFNSDELPIIAKGIQDFSKLHTIESNLLVQSQMGDGEEGSAYGRSTLELRSAVDIINVSLARTQQIADILAIHPSQVDVLMRLITLYEPEDGMIYTQSAGRVK